MFDALNYSSKQLFRFHGHQRPLQDARRRHLAFALSLVTMDAAGRLEVGRKFVVLPVFLDEKSSDDNHLDEALFMSVHSSVGNRGLITSENPLA